MTYPSHCCPNFLNLINRQFKNKWKRHGVKKGDIIYNEYDVWGHSHAFIFNGDDVVKLNYLGCGPTIPDEFDDINEFSIEYWDEIGIFETSNRSRYLNLEKFKDEISHNAMIAHTTRFDTYFISSFEIFRGLVYILSRNSMWSKSIVQYKNNLLYVNCEHDDPVLKKWAPKELYN